MKSAREAQITTAAIKRPAVLGAVRHSAAATAQPARALQQHLGNHATAAFVHFFQHSGATPVLQRRAPSCPDGFRRYPKATWFHCGEAGARKLACAVCNEGGRRDCTCNSVVDTVGTNIIAPRNVGKCGDVFEVALPGGGDVHEAIKAEVPGGVELDMHRDFVVNTLGLPEDQGHYDVCLRKTGRNPDVIACGDARCKAPPNVNVSMTSAVGDVSKNE